MPMITVNNVYHRLDGLEVLSGASLQIERGRFAALIGKSGEGKTVLLKHMAGLMQPDSGRVLIDGNDLCCLSRRKLQQLRRRFGFVFQSGALFDSMTVYENVAFPLREKNNGMTEPEIHEKVMNEIGQVGLSGSENKLPAHLSGGMIKRAALARGLVVEPEIMFFDEPVTGLDPMIGHTILELIHECHERHHFTGVIVTHQLKDVFAVVHEVAMLHEGKIYFHGTPEEIQASGDHVISDFITGNTEGLADRRTGA